MSKTALSRTTEVPSGGISHLSSTPLPRSIVQVRCNGPTQTRTVYPRTKRPLRDRVRQERSLWRRWFLVARLAGSSSSHRGQHGGRCGQGGHRSLNSLGPGPLNAAILHCHHHHPVNHLPHVLAVRRENIICRQISDLLSAILCRFLNSPRPNVVTGQQLALFVTWRPST